MQEEIKVYVVKYPDRDNLVMRYKCPLTGKQVSRSTGTAKQKEAEKAAAKWEAELQEGRYQKSSRMAWGELVPMFLATLEVKPATIANYWTTFQAFDELCRPERVSDLTSERIRAFKASLRTGRKYKAADGKTKTRKVSEATIHKHLRNLRTLAIWAHGEGLLQHKPKFEMPKAADAQRMKGRPIVLEEFERMIKATTKVVGKEAAPSWKFLLRGLWWSGLRISEAMALRWDDAGDVSVSLTRSVLKFYKQKNGKVQETPLAPEAVDFLAPRQRTAGYVFNPRRKDGELLARHVLKVSKIVSAIGKAAGVVTEPDKGRTASAHDLRRSFGTRWSKRVMPAALMQLMRHADIKTTMAYYANQAAEETALELRKLAGTNLGTTAKTKTTKRQKTS